MRKRVDMAGQRFDRLTVICFDHRDSGDSLWRCRCDCGNEVVVRRKNLLSGLTKSCGCDRRTTKNISADFARKHGCSVCADKKYCDRTICKYENEFARRKKNEMEAKEE